MPNQFTPPHSRPAESKPLGTAAHPESGGYQLSAGENGANAAHQVGGLSIAGTWDADRWDYTLTDNEEHGIVNVPNHKRLGNGLDHSQSGQKVARQFTATHSPTGNISGKVVNHISRVDNVQLPRGLAASYEPGSVINPAFSF